MDEIVPSGSTASAAGRTFGSGSVAHQIIGEFLIVLRQTDEYRQISERLEAVVFGEKVTESALRTALFGEEPL
jgi:hypothetical protein